METILYNQLIKYLLPKEMVEYFDITAIESQGEELTLTLEEKNLIPKEHEGKKVLSKGFYPESTMEDFPIREYKVYLKIRRRKWIDTASGQIISRDWELTAKGTSYTKEFGAFLKDMARYFPC